MDAKGTLEQVVGGSGDVVIETRVGVGKDDVDDRVCFVLELGLALSLLDRPLDRVFQLAPTLLFRLLLRVPLGPDRVAQLLVWDEAQHKVPVLRRQDLVGEEDLRLKCRKQCPVVDLKEEGVQIQGQCEDLVIVLGLLQDQEVVDDRCSCCVVHETSSLVGDPAMRSSSSREDLQKMTNKR